VRIKKADVSGVLACLEIIPAFLHDARSPTSRIAGADQHDAARPQIASAFLQQRQRLAQMFNHFEQADRIELCIVEMLFLEQTRMHAAASGACGGGNVRRWLHAFGFKASAGGGSNKIAA